MKYTILYYFCGEKITENLESGFTAKLLFENIKKDKNVSYACLINNLTKTNENTFIR